MSIPATNRVKQYAKAPRKPKAVPKPLFPEDTEGQYEHAHPTPEKVFKPLPPRPEPEPAAPAQPQTHPSFIPTEDIPLEGNTTADMAHLLNSLGNGHAERVLGDALQEAGHPSLEKAGQIVSQGGYVGRHSAGDNSPPEGHLRIETLHDNPVEEPIGWVAHLHHPKGTVHSWFRSNLVP